MLLDKPLAPPGAAAALAADGHERWAASPGMCVRMNKCLFGLLLVTFASCAASERQTFTGGRDQGHGPGIELGLVLVGDRVESGTFSLVAPEGMESADEPSRLDYPMLEMVQDGAEVSFRVELRVGSGVQPFRFSARLAPQENGTLHVHLHQHESSGQPADYTDPPMVLSRVGANPSNKSQQPTGAPTCQASEDSALQPPPRQLTFADFSSWTYIDGLDGMPASVKALSGQRVQVTGALMPIDQSKGHEFHLVDPARWGRRGRDVHQEVRVVLPEEVQGGRVTDVVRVVGTFIVEPLVIDGYCVEIFRIEVESFERTTWQQ